jgi:DNA-binding NarL/FixJ family response regulator
MTYSQRFPKLPKRIPAHDLRLTPKEKEVAKLVAAGFRNKAIALTIGTTEQVIKNTLRFIFDKLGFDNRTELALWYVKREKGNS